MITTSISSIGSSNIGRPSTPFIKQRHGSPSRHGPRPDDSL
jgi:hypothetical protein